MGSSQAPPQLALGLGEELLGGFVRAGDDRQDATGGVAHDRMSEGLVLVAVEIVQHDGFRPGVGGGRLHALVQVFAEGLDPVGHLFQLGRVAGGRGRHESVQGGLDGRAQFDGVLGKDADGMQHPAARSVKTQEEPALAFVKSGINMQGIAARHGAAQGRSPQQVQALQEVQEAVAEGGGRAVREDDAALGEGGADFLTLAHVVVVALQSGPDDRVVAEALSQGRQVDQLLRAQRRGGAARAVAAELALPEGAGRQCGQRAGLALLGVQVGATAGALAGGGLEVQHEHGSRTLQGAGRWASNTASSLQAPPILDDLREVEASEDGADLGQMDGRGKAAQVTRQLCGGGDGVAQQGQQNFDHDGGIDSGGAGAAALANAEVALRALAVGDGGVGGEVDEHAVHALAVDLPAAHGGEQEGVGGDVQEGAQFFVDPAGRGLADQACHGGGERA